MPLCYVSAQRHNVLFYLGSITSYNALVQPAALRSMFLVFTDFTV